MIHQGVIILKRHVLLRDCSQQTAPSGDPISGLKTMASRWTMSGQNVDLTDPKPHSPVMLASHVMLRRSCCSFLNKISNPQL